jgi:hypothetical protein
MEPQPWRGSSKENYMTKLYRYLLILMSVWLLDSAIAIAQEAKPAALPRSGHIKVEMVPSLFVMNADGAALKGHVLTLTGVSPSSIVFADRPVRAAGHVSTSDLVKEWDPGNNSFAKNPPNATVSVLSKDASSAQDAVVVLKNPRLDGDHLSFDVDVLEGGLADADGPAAVFIDIIGMPWTPLSYAGMARRTARRAFWYGTAAHYAYPHPYYPPPPPYPYYPPPHYYYPPPPY